MPERVLGSKARPEVVERLLAFTVSETPVVMALMDFMKQTQCGVKVKPGSLEAGVTVQGEMTGAVPW